MIRTGNYLKTIILLAVTIILTSPCTHALTAPEIQTIIDSAPAAKDMPDAQAVILYRKTVVTLPDKTHRTVDEEVLLKVLTGKGKHNFGDIKLRFDRRYEKIDLEKAETFTPGGKILPVMQGADNTIIPPEVADAVIYDAVRERVISLSGVEPGSVLHWIVHRSTAYPAGDRFLWGSRSFQQRIPVVHDIYEVQFGKEIPFQYYLMNGLDQPVSRLENDMKILFWEVHDVPMIQSEWYMVDLFNIVPRVLYTTAPGWNAVAKWWRTMFDVSDAVNSEKLQAFVKQLLEGKSTRWARLDAVYRWTADTVRNIPLPLGLRGYHPMNIDTILENQYGDSLDKAFLLVSMLRIAGFRAEPLLFQSTRRQIPDSLPSVDPFNSLGVVIPRKDSEPIFLDPSGENLRTGYFLSGQNNIALQIGTEDFQIIRIPQWPPERSVSRQEMDITVHPDGSAFGHLRWTGTGYFDYAVRSYMKEKTPRERKMRLSRLLNSEDFPAELQSFSVSEMTDFNQDTNLEISMDIPGFGVVEGDVMIIDLPGFPLHFTRIFLPDDKAERRYPIRMRSTGVMESTLTVKIPKQFHIMSSPGKASADSPGLSVDQSEKITGDTVIITRKWTWKLPRINPDQFAATRKVYGRFNHLKQNVLLLEKQ